MIVSVGSTHDIWCPNKTRNKINEQKKNCLRVGHPLFFVSNSIFYLPFTFAALDITFPEVEENDFN